MKSHIDFRNLLGAALLAVLGWSRPVAATTVTHTYVPDFSTGITTGAAAVTVEQTSGTPPNGAVGILPETGAIIFNDDFDYQTLTAAQGGGWLFLTPNSADNATLTANPPEFLFSGDTSTTGTAPPSSGFLRIVASRPNELFDTGNAAQDQPVLAVRNKALTGDFIVETKISFPTPRLAGEARQHGIFIGEPGFIMGDEVSDVNVGADADYIITGPLHDVSVASTGRFGSGAPAQFSTASFPGDTFYVRVVKRGMYFYTFLRATESDPWIFHAWFKNAALAATPDAPVVVGLFEKSWGTTGGAATQYKPTDYDYFRVYQLGPQWTGTFANVMDAGQKVDWRTLSLSATSMQGTRYQLRTGNTLSGGTLTDAGPFAGPDGTDATFFEDDVAQVIPDANGKRYLEYKLYLDNTPANLPAFVSSISADYTPEGVASEYASDAPKYGGTGGGIGTQPGDGDLSLIRTLAFSDDFNQDPSTNGWTFTNRGEGYGLIGSYTTTERPGYLRMKVGPDQNIWGGAYENGGVTLLRPLPASIDVNDFEIEAEVDMEAQQSRNAQIVLWQDIDNWVGIGVSRVQPYHFHVGVGADGVMNDVGQSGFTSYLPFYGSNTMHLRIAKEGQTITFSYRDLSSPSWRVLFVYNAAGKATGGADFVPAQVGLLGKSYSGADPGPVDYDYNWFHVSALAPTGTKDVTLTLPAGSRLDSILLNGELTVPASTKAQVKAPSGDFVGPDGTSATYFTTYEPKVPASLTDTVSPQVRLTMDAAQPSGAPYLHALGAQYVAPGAALAHDTNAADFAAGTLKSNVDLTTNPGAVANAGGLQPGPVSVDDFSSDIIASGAWAWDNPTNPSGNSAYSFTENPGWLRIRINKNENLWKGAANKYYVLARRAKRVSGDWEIETYINFPNGRTSGHQMGLGVFQDANNLILFGPSDSSTGAQQMVALRIENDATDQRLVGTYAQTAFTLRIRKVGNKFYCYARPDGAADFTLIYTHTSNTIVTPYIGVMGKSFSPATETDFPVDYDSFSYTPLDPNGAFVSRPLDLGQTGLTPWVETLGGNAAAVQILWRAADTEAGLASAAWVGADAANAPFAGTYTGLLPNSLAGKRFLQYQAVLPQGTSLNDIMLLGLTGVILPLTRDDAMAALRIAGGLVAATPDQVSRYDLVKGDSDGKVDLLDAAAVLRAASGL